MKQKTRLFISFGTIVVVPVILFYMSIRRMHEQLYDLGETGWRYLTMDLSISTLLILIFTAYMLMDWLERTDAAERREQVRQEREWLRDLSHDLKTPLTTIQGYAEGMMDGIADSTQKRELYIKTIYHKTSELTDLVDELSQYSQKDGKTLSYNFQKVKANDYFDSCIRELRSELEGKNIKIVDVSRVGDDVEIEADTRQLRRAISNIIRNCVRYMDKPEGRILMRTTDVGEFVQVEIEDNGSGIAPEALPYIFDRYYRADAVRNKRPEGCGIGLSIAKKVIEGHGGRIWATGEQGIGTVIGFTVRKYQEGRYEENSDH